MLPQEDAAPPPFNKAFDVALAFDYAEISNFALTFYYGKIIEFALAFNFTSAFNCGKVFKF